MWGFSIRVDTPVTQADRVFTFPDGGTPTRLYTVSIAERVYNWSSNNYSLDFTIEDSYYQDLPDTTKHPMSYLLAYFAAGVNGRPHWVFFPFGLAFVDDHFFELPPAPSTWWSPPTA